jgi:hypothetical protein
MLQEILLLAIAGPNQVVTGDAPGTERGLFVIDQELREREL